jgi:hypothetical protein
VLLFCAYSAGVSYGHWVVASYTQAEVGTGNLGLGVTDPPPGFTLDGSSQSGLLTLANSGTVPTAASLEWDYGPAADPGLCSLFDVLIQDAGSGAAVFDGSLCELIGHPLPVASQLDPGGSASLEIVVGLHPGADPGDDVTLPLLSRATFWQWASASPGSPGSYGWWGSVEGSFEVRFVAPMTAGPTLLAQEPARNSEATSAPTGEATTTTTTVPLDDGTTATGTTSAPPEETTNTTTEAPPEETTNTTTEAPPEETTTTTTTAAAEPVPEETTTTASTPPPEETVTLRGRVWEDLDEDGMTVLGHAGQEPGVAGVAVTLRGEDGTSLMTTFSGPDGTYQFADLDPGAYRVEFRAPEGFSLHSPGVAGGTDTAGRAAALGIPVEQVVGDDLSRAEATDGDALVRAETDVFVLDVALAEKGGDTDGPADAALVRLAEPSEEETAGATSESGVPDGQAMPPADQAGSSDPGNGQVDPNTQGSRPDEPQLQQPVPVGDGAGSGGDGGGGQEAAPQPAPSGDDAPAGGGEGSP